MGLVYLPTFIRKKNKTIHVSKHTSPMDCMGTETVTDNHPHADLHDSGVLEEPEPDPGPVVPARSEVRITYLHRGENVMEQNYGIFFFWGGWNETWRGLEVKTNVVIHGGL